MKTLFVILMVLMTSSAFAKTKSSFVCSVREAKKVVPIAEAHSSFDKNRHCSVSCMLALRCNRNEVFLAGILKELKDVFGPGNAEVEDIKADKTGIQIARSERARTNQECLDQCDLYYH